MLPSEYGGEGGPVADIEGNSLSTFNYRPCFLGLDLQNVEFRFAPFRKVASKGDGKQELVDGTGPVNLNYGTS